jgi:hypothetical protein
MLSVDSVVCVPAAGGCPGRDRSASAQACSGPRRRVRRQIDREVMGMERRRWRPLVVAALAVATGVALVAARGTASAAVTPRLTSVEIADAVLFDTGPAAKYVASVQRGQVRWTAELRGIRAGVDAALTADPTGYYASEFATAMQSGDPRAVQQALGRLGKTVRGYLERRYGPSQLDDALRVMGTAPSAAREPRDLDSPVITTDVAVAVVIVAAFLIVVVFGAVDDATPSDRLAGEKLANDLAVSLRYGR